MPTSDDYARPGEEGEALNGDVVLPFDRTRPTVSQDTGWFCGPAAAQQALIVRGLRVDEATLARDLGTTVNGTDHVGLVRDVLNRRLGNPGYVVREIADPASTGATERYFDDIIGSVNAGYGVVDNIMVPPSNYPRGARGENVGYSGGFVYHYRFVAGYNLARREILVVDSGFAPNIYWQSVDQAATCVAGKGYTACPIGAPAPTPVAPDGVTAEVLSEAMGASMSVARYRELLPAFVESMRLAQITTPLRAAHWCAQIGHESAGLRHPAELWGPTPAQRGYEGRADLGNTEPGDGFRFRGHGWLQITGRHNHAQVSLWAFAKRLVTSPTYFVDEPNELGSDRFAGLGAAWYWTIARPQLSALADADDVVAVTRAINGGTNGLDDRRRRLAICKALGPRLLPTQKGTIMSDLAAEELTKRFPSRSKYRAGDGFVDTLAGFVLNIDARIHEEFVERNALLGDPACIVLIRREAAKGDAGAAGVLAQIDGGAR